MKNNWRTNFLVLLISLVTFFTFSQNALSSSYVSGTTTIDWTSFTITYDPVTMSLNWLFKSDQTYAYANIGGPDATDSDGPISPWGAVSSSAVLDDEVNLRAAASAYTNAFTIGQSYDGHVLSSGSGQANGTAGRYGTFSVTGSGDITFSANYHLDYTLTTDPCNYWAYASNLASLYGKNYSTALDTYGVPGSYDLRTKEVSNGEDASLTVDGTLHATLHFNNGDAGFFLAGVGDPNKLEEWAPVPEPATMLLLASGLIGLAGYGRKKFFKK